MRLTLPSDRTPPRPDAGPGIDPDRLRYLQSYLVMRLVIGGMGVALPLGLVVGDALLAGDDFPRGSLSAYYHSGARDAFVAALCVTGVFLITYMVNQYNWDNVISIVSGVAAIGVALFPTDGGPALTPLQDALGEIATRNVHYASATVFILSLAVMSYLFGLRESRRPDRDETRRAFWGRFHKACAGVIVLAVVGFGIVKAFDVGIADALFYAETTAVLSFGASWFTKGLELQWLRSRTAIETAAATAAA